MICDVIYVLMLRWRCHCVSTAAPSRQSDITFCESAAVSTVLAALCSNVSVMEDTWHSCSPQSVVSVRFDEPVWYKPEPRIMSEQFIMPIFSLVITNDFTFYGSLNSPLKESCPTKWWSCKKNGDPLVYVHKNGNNSSSPSTFPFCPSLPFSMKHCLQSKLFLLILLHYKKE